jgi:hypothetical protein
LDIELQIYNPTECVTIKVFYEGQTKDVVYIVDKCSSEKADAIFTKIRKIQLTQKRTSLKLSHDISIIIDPSLQSINMIELNTETDAVAKYSRDFLQDPIVN